MTGPGRRPFGYGGDRVTIEAAEADAIRAATQRVLAGEPVAAIARDWNRSGPATVSGVPWSAPTVRRILLSGRIAGWHERDGRLVDRAGWPPIIDLDRHLRLKGALSGRQGRARSYLLTGFVFCANCGKNMEARPVIENGVKRRRYACNASNGGCGQVGISADGLERHVVTLLAQPAHRRERTAPGSVTILEARLDELANAFAGGEITRPEWVRARTEIVDRLDAARRQLSLPVGVDREMLDTQPFRVQRAYVSSRVESVRVAPRRGGNRFDPSRVKVVMRP